MTKKRVSLIASGTLLVSAIVILVAFAVLPQGPGVTKANFDRIEDGMKLEEVEQILGGTGQPFHGFADLKHLETLVWARADGEVIFVHFFNDSVTGKRWSPSTETILDKFRRWLRLPK